MTKTIAPGAAGLAFWVIALVALVWNGLGCVNLFQQMSAAGLETLPEEYRAFIETRPLWALLGFALSVISGLTGSILLMMRSRHAVLAFSLSMIGALIATLPVLGLGIPSLIIGSGMSVVLAAFFAWYASNKLKP